MARVSQALGAMGSRRDVTVSGPASRMSALAWSYGYMVRAPRGSICWLSLIGLPSMTSPPPSTLPMLGVPAGMSVPSA